jgi:ABC-type sugar transport system permease subunit
MRASARASSSAPPGTGNSRHLPVPLLFLLPSILLLTAINAYPLVAGLALSFQKGSLIHLGGFVGLDQYARLANFSPFWSAVRFTLEFTVASVVGSYVAGLGLALLLFRIRALQGFLRAGLMISWIVPSVVAAISFKWAVTDERGIVNGLLGTFSLGPVFLLSTPALATVSVIVLKIWRTFPFLMVTLLAARGLVPDDLYEAANLDGAGRWATFRHITLPLMARVSIVGSLMVAIWSFNDFETIWLLTRGGPSGSTQNLMTESYNLTFVLNDVGLGAALAVVSLVLQMVLAWVLVRTLKRYE